jgi:hypothetical protein
MEFCMLNPMMIEKKMPGQPFKNGVTFTVSYGETRRKWRL